METPARDKERKDRGRLTNKVISCSRRTESPAEQGTRGTQKKIYEEILKEKKQEERKRYRNERVRVGRALGEHRRRGSGVETASSRVGQKKIELVERRG